MSDERVSKLLSYMLRHRPEEHGLTLDDAGWVEVEALLAALSRAGNAVTRTDLERIVGDSDKQRFAFSTDGARIRANQGHSVHVELGHAPQRPPALLYHGTVERSLAGIRAEGLVKGERHHVHLSATLELANQVGARRGRPVVLEVDAAAMHADGHEFLCTPNGVWLTAHVPARYLRFPR